MSKPTLAAKAALVALLFGSAPASLPAAEAPAAPQVSAAATKVLLAAQQAAEQQKYPEVIASAEAALAIGGRTPADVFVANQYLALAHDKQGNKASVLAALQGQLDSGYPDAAAQDRINTQMTRIAYEQKNYPQAVELGERLVRSGAADAAMYGVIGDSLYQQGKHAEASKFLADHVADQERGGVVPRERTLNTLYAAQEKSGSKAAVTATLEKLVAHYPKPEYWTLVLYSMIRDPALTERQSLQVYRLMQAAQTLTRCTDVTGMAEAATDTGMPGEALKALEAGIASQACAAKPDHDRLLRMQGVATGAATEDKAALGKLEAEAKAAQSGELDVVVGSSLFGYGELSRSIEALSRGIGKGGLKNPADAQIMLGMAQMQAGALPEALRTFRAVQSEDPFTQRIVRLWILRAR